MLLCQPARERGLLAPVPVGAAAAGAAGFVLVVAGIWAAGAGDGTARVAATLPTASAGGTPASLAFLPRLPLRRQVLLRLVQAPLLVAALVSLPVLHRLAREALPAAAVGFCPFCGASLAAPA